jgi:hypothetical protein
MEDATHTRGSGLHRPERDLKCQRPRQESSIPPSLDTKRASPCKANPIPNPGEGCSQTLTDAARPEEESTPRWPHPFYRATSRGPRSIIIVGRLGVAASGIGPRLHRAELGCAWKIGRRSIDRLAALFRVETGNVGKISSMCDPGRKCRRSGPTQPPRRPIGESPAVANGWGLRGASRRKGRLIEVIVPREPSCFVPITFVGWRRSQAVPIAMGLISFMHCTGRS